MCGRYVTSRSAAEIADVFAIDRDATSEPLEADYNVAPTKRVPMVCERQTDDASGREAERQLRDVRWGLVPSWTKSLDGTSRPLINARAESAADKPAFRRALATRRCLLPTDGYYEWHTDTRGRRQPHFIHADESGLAMAGLYELWRDPEHADDGTAPAWWWTCAILTTAADDSLAWLHHRMPVIVPPGRCDAWLDPSRPGADQLHALTATPAVRLRAYPVSPEVNSVHNNAPRLLRPWQTPDPSVQESIF